MPRTERVISVLLLVLIIGIGAGIFAKGQRYDPYLFELDPELLGDAPAAFSRVLPVAWQESTWEAGETVERYGPNTLYEKINGRADLYLSYSVSGLEVETFSANDGQWIDLFLFDMGTPLNAYGIYSAERTPGADTIEVGKEGYDAGGAVFFHSGKFYAQVIPSDDSPAARETSRLLATTLAGALPQESEATDDPTSVLPTENRDEDSVSYLKENVLGLEFLRNGVVANYVLGDEYPTVFAIQESDAATAQATLDAYIAYINGYGEILEDTETPNGRRIVGSVSGFHDVVIVQGSYIGGASGAMDRAVVEDLSRQLAERLPGA